MDKFTLKELRSLALSRQRAAGRKVSRLKGKGLQIAGSEFDPRRSNNSIGKYNGAQLKAYIKRLDSFIDRHNQYVATAEGQPVPKALWNAYKKEEAKYEEKRRRVEAKINKTIIKTSADGEMTVAGRRAMRDSPNPKAAGGATSNPMHKINRNAAFVNGMDAFKQILKDIRNRNGKGYLSKTLRSQRENQAVPLLASHGDESLIRRLRSLNEYQFNILWNETNFAENASGMYEQIQQDNGDDEGRRYEGTVYKNWALELHEQLEWAKTLKE